MKRKMVYLWPDHSLINLGGIQKQHLGCLFNFVMSGFFSVYQLYNVAEWYFRIKLP